MKKKKPSYLIRTGDREYMQNLVDKGEVYMNTLSFFAKGKTGNKSKDDKNEGRWMDSGHVMIGNANNCFEFSNLRHTGYVYCLTGFEDDVFKKGLSYRYLSQQYASRLGETSVLIWNPKQFYQRLASAVKKKGLSLQCDWVSYDIKSEQQFKTGELIRPFHKFEGELDWENEFRFYVPASCSDEAITFDLGPLNDIACIMEDGKRYDLIHMHDNVYEVFSSDDIQ